MKSLSCGDTASLQACRSETCKYLRKRERNAKKLDRETCFDAPIPFVFVQVPEQQQDQRVRAGSAGPSGFIATGSKTESKPNQPDPHSSLSAPKAHPAVSASAGNHLKITVCVLLESLNLLNAHP